MEHVEYVDTIEQRWLVGVLEELGQAPGVKEWYGEHIEPALRSLRGGHPPPTSRDTKNGYRLLLRAFASFERNHIQELVRTCMAHIPQDHRLDHFSYLWAHAELRAEVQNFVISALMGSRQVNKSSYPDPKELEVVDSLERRDAQFAAIIDTLMRVWDLWKMMVAHVMHSNANFGHLRTNSHGTGAPPGLGWPPAAPGFGHPGHYDPGWMPHGNSLAGRDQHVPRARSLNQWR
ncbi:hypothetical protein OIO90_004254 [Microbotryomycetes sp. JL221]|nr:hypothetical protein OIO90_004254 [Microbotryomycetes sp. JL221]